MCNFGRFCYAVSHICVVTFSLSFAGATYLKYYKLGLLEVCSIQLGNK